MTTHTLTALMKLSAGILPTPVPSFFQDLEWEEDIFSCVDMYVRHHTREIIGTKSVHLLFSQEFGIFFFAIMFCAAETDVDSARFLLIAFGMGRGFFLLNG